MDETKEGTITPTDDTQLEQESNGPVTEIPNDIDAEPNLATTAGDLPTQELETPQEPVEQEPVPVKNNNRTITIIVVVGLLLLVIGSLVAMLLLAQGA